MFPSSLRKKTSPAPPPPKHFVQQDHSSAGFKRVAAATSKGPGFRMPSQQRLLSAVGATLAGLREKAPAASSQEKQDLQEVQLEKALAAKRRIALQKMRKNAIADEIVDGTVGTGEVFNKNPFEIRKELPRTPEVPPMLAHISLDQSSSHTSGFSRLAPAEKLSPFNLSRTASLTTTSYLSDGSMSRTIVSAQQSPLAGSHSEPSPAHQSAAAAYYAALLNPTPPRVIATASDMASPLLKYYVSSHSVSSASSVSKFARSPVAFPPSPSRYAGDPFPSSPAIRFKTEESFKHSSSASGSILNTPDAESSPVALAYAPNSASSASSWLNRRENSQCDVSNLPSPNVVTVGTTPWKACKYHLHIFAPLLLLLLTSLVYSCCGELGCRRRVL